MRDIPLSQFAIILLIIITLVSTLSIETMNVFQSIGVYLSTFLIFLAYLSYGKVTLKFIIYIFVFIFYMIISLYYNSGGIGSVLTFVLAVTSLELLSKIDFRLIYWKYICPFLAIMIILLFFASFQYNTGQGFDYNGMVNPNSVAMVSNYCFGIFLCTQHLRTNKCILGILGLITLCTTFNCEARGALLALISFMALLTVPNKLLSSKLLLIFSIIIVVIGTLIPFIYLNLYEQNFQLDFMLNKPLFTGRQRIWLEAFNLFGNDTWNWILGIGSKVKLWDAATNLHNLYFTAIVDFGIIGYLLYFGFIFRFIWHVCMKISSSNEAKKYLFLFISLSLIQGYTETSILNATTVVLSNFGLARAYNLLYKEKFNDT